MSRLNVNIGDASPSRRRVAVVVDRRCPDPGRSHAWRWGRATELFRLDLRPDPLDDAAVRAAWSFLRDTAAAETQQEMKAAREQNPLLTMAHRVFRDAGPIREQIESMLLAGADVDAVAAATGLSQEAVEAYELLFFHVAHWIDPLEFPVRDKQPKKGGQN